MNIRRSWALWALGIFAAVATAGGEGAAQQGLDQPLEVQVTQTGFAGETGRAWTVQPDGSWAIRDIGPGASPGPVATGRLTEAQLGQLHASLDRNDFRTLPSETGAAAVPVNPHRVTISLGGRKVVVTTPPGEDPLATVGAARGSWTPEGRVAAIVHDVRRLTAQ